LKDISSKNLQPRKNITCQQIRAVLREHGVNGAIEVVPVEQWHPLGQLIGTWRKELAVDLNEVVSLTQYATAITLKSYLTTLTNGIMHGAIWHMVGTNDSLLLSERVWPQLLHVIDAPAGPDWDVMDHWNLGHGLGHGFVIRHSEFGKTYDDCWTSTQPGVIRQDEFLAATSACGMAWSMSMAFDCVIGATHSYMEHDTSMALLPDHARTWYQPCDRVAGALSGACFLTLFNWMGHGNQDWRVAQLRAMPRWWNACRSIKSDVHRRGCVYGLSANIYMFWEATVAAPGAEQLANDKPSREACLNSVETERKGEHNQRSKNASVAVDDPAVYCNLIFASRPPTRLTATPFLDYCSKFGAPWEDRRDQLEFLACVSGGMFNPVGGYVMFDLVTMDAVRSFCDQFVDVAWTPDADLRHEARHHCETAAGFLKGVRLPSQSWASFRYPFTDLLAQTNYWF